MEGQPIKSFEVRDNKNNLILINKGDSLFLEDFGPDEEHVTIYPLFRVINYDTLQIEVSFTFYPELSCAYTSENIETLSNDDRIKIFNYMDLIIRYAKARQAYAR